MARKASLGNEYFGQWKKGHNVGVLSAGLGGGLPHMTTIEFHLE